MTATNPNTNQPAYSAVSASDTTPSISQIIRNDTKVTTIATPIPAWVFAGACK